MGRAAAPPGRRPGKGLRLKAQLAAWAGLALALRLWQADGPGLWHDEALEWQRAVLPWGPLLAGRAIDQDPPLMALGLRLWLGWGADDQELWLRAPSALWGAALVFLLGAIAARRWGPGLGLRAAALAALAPVLVHYGQELNQYAGVATLGLLLWWAADLHRRRGGPGDAGRLTACSLVGLAWHYGLAFPILVHTVGWARRLRPAGDPATAPAGPSDASLAAGRPPARAAWPPFALHLALLGGLALALWRLGLGARLATPHSQARLFGTGPIKELDYLADHLWRELVVFQFTPFAGGPALAAAGGMGLLALWGAGLLWRGKAGGERGGEGDGEPATIAADRRGSGRALIAHGLGTLGLLYGVDLLGLYPLGNRWALFLSPTLLLALAAGIAGLARLRTGAGGLALGLALGAFALLLPQGDGATASLAVPREPLPEALAWLAERHRPGEPVYVSHAAGPALAYYRHRARLDGGRRAADGPRAVRDLDAALLPGAAPSDRPPAADLADLLERHPGACRLWLLLLRSEPGQAEALRAALGARGWEQGGAWGQDGARVEGWEMNAPACPARRP